MIPILYEATETDFNHNGIGILNDTISCNVTEIRNGAYEIEIVYPISGSLYQKIQEDCIVKAKPNDKSSPQLFRIYKSSKPISGKVSFFGEHISYRLKDVPIQSVRFDGKNAQAALSEVLSSGIFAHGFTGQSDITTENSISLALVSVRAALGGVEGSLLDVYGGEYEFDNFNVILHKNRGRDSGIRISYGKNLTDIQQESNISEVYTAVFPYAKYASEADDSEDILVTLPEKVLYSPHKDNYASVKTCFRDFSEEFEDDETITIDALREKALLWVKTSGFDIPSVNIKISFKAIWDSPEYENYAVLERVGLCDMVSVYYGILGVSVKAKVIKTVYDSLGERYLSMELGEAKPNLINTITRNEKMADVASRNISYANSKVVDLGIRTKYLSSIVKEQVVPGVNYLKNSSGIGDLREWEHSGTVSAIHEPEIERRTVSGSCFRLRSGKISQNVRVVKGKNYCFSFLLKKTDHSGWVKIFSGEQEYVVFHSVESSDWKEYFYRFSAAGDSVAVEVYSNSGELLIADMILTDGTMRNNWKPSPNELYTEHIKLDAWGIEKNGYPVLGFAGRINNEDIDGITKQGIYSIINRGILEVFEVSDGEIMQRVTESDCSAVLLRYKKDVWSEWKRREFL